MTPTQMTNDAHLADIDRLQALARKAAAAVRTRLARADREGYLRFLNGMYHYTRGSGDKTLRAMKACPTPDLRAWFEHMYREERGHYLLAEADLHALGYDVQPATPPAVARFNDWWNGVDPLQFTAWVGALVVFENVANHAADEVVAMVKRLGLAKKESRWLLVHVEADQGHGAEALDVARRYLAVDRASLLAGAEKACALWIDVFQSAFDDPIELPRLPS
jgi:hypothetical protein